MTERTDDYIKNMIRRMLVAEGWTRAEPTHHRGVSHPPNSPVVLDDWRTQIMVDAINAAPPQ